MIQKPNYTQIPNVYFDSIMQTLNGSENLVFLTIMRKTFGWRKKKDRIAYSQIMLMTGLAKSTTATAIKTLEERGLIVAEKDGQIVSYYVNVDDTTVPKIEPVRKSNRYENRTGAVPKIEPVESETVPKIEHTKESNINKLTKEIYIAIEEKYVACFKDVIPNGEPIIDYGRVRKRIKEVLEKISVDKILCALETAKRDDWIVRGGYSLSVILTDYQLNKLLNGKQQAPGYSKPVRDLSNGYTLPDGMDEMPGEGR